MVRVVAWVSCTNNNKEISFIQLLMLYGTSAEGL